MQHLLLCLQDSPDNGNLNTRSWSYCTHQTLSTSWQKDFPCHNKPLHPNQLPSLDTDATLDPPGQRSPEAGPSLTLDQCHLFEVRASSTLVAQQLILEAGCPAADVPLRAGLQEEGHSLRCVGTEARHVVGSSPSCLAYHQMQLPSTFHVDAGTLEVAGWLDADGGVLGTGQDGLQNDTQGSCWVHPFQGALSAAQVDLLHRTGTGLPAQTTAKTIPSVHH